MSISSVIYACFREVFESSVPLYVVYHCVACNSIFFYLSRLITDHFDVIALPWIKKKQQKMVRISRLSNNIISSAIINTQFFFFYK